MNDSDELDLDQNNDEKEDESMDETQHLQLPNNNNNIDPKAVTRSSSLGQIMGNFLRSISSKSIAQEDSSDDESTDENEKAVISKNNNKKQISSSNRRSKGAESIRSAGTVGTAVTSTNESDFVSADEGYDSDENLSEPHVSITAASEHTNEVNVEVEDVSDVASTDTIEHDDTYDAASVLGESTQHESEFRKTSADLLTEKLAEEKEKESQQQPEQELDGKVDKSIDEAQVAQPQDSEASSDSFASDKFVLELTDFDDDLYSLSSHSFDARSILTKSLKKNGRVSSESSDKDAVLSIWQTQPVYSELPKTRLPEKQFQSICDPVKKFVYKPSDSKPRQVRVVSSERIISGQSQRSQSSSSSTCGLNRNYGSIIYRNPSATFRLPSAESRAAGRGVIPSFSENNNSVIITPMMRNQTSESGPIYERIGDEVAEESDAEEVEEESEESANPFLETKKPAAIGTATGEINEAEQSVEHASQMEPPSSLLKAVTQRNVSNVSQNSNSDSLNQMLENSINLSIGELSNDESFLQELKHWDEDHHKQKKETSLTESHNDQLTHLWRTGTISSMKKFDDATPKTKKPKMTADEMEEYMKHKRMTSDDFQIKAANGQFEINSFSPTGHMPQKGLMVELGPNNETLPPPSINAEYENETDSVIIPDLGIASGIEATNSTLEDFSVYEDSQLQIPINKNVLGAETKSGVDEYGKVRALSDLDSKKTVSDANEKAHTSSTAVLEEQTDDDATEKVRLLSASSTASEVKPKKSKIPDCVRQRFTSSHNRLHAN
ncbi:unnamed protein product [Ambrosiozyma monospora]|uniref:Unnamed protein product n=1 Tax=Ambrosiozyma monospora TaxID=43982 RepID=A0ACB5T832_AMBMO|nr:unnamed protein product [Ambrosiozyma monospora]